MRLFPECLLFFFFNDTATTEIYTRSIVGSVRCVQETGINAEYMGKRTMSMALKIMAPFCLADRLSLVVLFFLFNFVRPVYWFSFNPKDCSEAIVYAECLSFIYFPLTRILYIWMSLIAYYANYYLQRNIGTRFFRNFFWILYVICFLLQAFHCRILYNAARMAVGLGSDYLQCFQWKEEDFAWNTVIFLLIIVLCFIMIVVACFCQFEVMLAFIHKGSCVYMHILTACGRDSVIFEERVDFVDDLEEDVDDDGRSTVCEGFTDEQLERLDILDETQSQSLCQKAVCPICFEHLFSEAKVCRLPCHHLFHYACLRFWLLRRSTCPKCRLNLKYYQSPCTCLLYTSPSPRDLSTSRMPSSA
eukprot:TRINITY_DN2688_c0_g1_i1.p1 TRINITY_DN2688_c0_g1~~TRINITY_DN2688_c0_g1_i1.p1  ORF type:complete len:360 (+),score=43.69 TRINITY_DN2688_c0_g1_i1:94-1173(+)